MLHSLQALSHVLHSLTGACIGIRAGLHMFTSHRKVDRALLNVEDALAAASVALSAAEPHDAYKRVDEAFKALYETKEDIVRVHDLFHREADNAETPAVFRFNVEALVLGFNTAMSLGRFSLIERMALPEATDAEREETIGLLHEAPQVRMMKMDPEQFFRMFQHPPEEDPS